MVENKYLHLKFESPRWTKIVLDFQVIQVTSAQLTGHYTLAYTAVLRKFEYNFKNLYIHTVFNWECPFLLSMSVEITNKKIASLSLMNDKCKNVVLLLAIISLMWVNHRLKRINFSILYLLSIVRNWIPKESIFIIRACFAFHMVSDTILFLQKFLTQFFKYQIMINFTRILDASLGVLFSMENRSFRY